MHREKRLEELCILYRENRATPEEAQELLAYFATQPPEALDQLLRPIQAAFTPVPGWQPPVAVADMVAIAQQQHTQQQVRKHRRLYHILSAAAACIIIAAGICFYTLQPPAPQTISYQTGKHPATYTLPDGSTLHLISNSRLSYTKTSQQRQIQLTGAAFFDIAPDAQHPCIIQAGNVLTQILGTSLSIDAMAGKAATTVTLLSGSIQVKKGQAAILLVPGQQIIIPRTSGQSQVKNVPVQSQQPYWLGQDTLLNHLRYQQVATLLSSRFGVTISFETEALRNETVHTQLYATESLTDIMDNLAALTSSHYQLQQQQVYIRK